MGHDQDFWETLRFRLARPIGWLLTGIEKKESPPDQFVGYVEMAEEEFEVELHDMGFERNPLSFWKFVPGSGEEQGSWRKNDGDWQLHVILFSSPSEEDTYDGPRTYVYAHWEYRWDRYPLRHLRGTDASASKGVNEMRRELNLASIPFYNDPTIQ